jgi:hypothetical protein
MKKTKNASRLFTVLLSAALLLSLLTATVPALAADPITVSFRLIGEDADGKFTTWIAAKSFSVPSGSTVLDVFTLALDGADITPTVLDLGWGAYVSAVAAPSALGDFTLSEYIDGEWPDATFAGWMFSVNNALSDAGVSDTVLAAGDSVVFFYTHDMNDGIDWETGDASNAPAKAAPDSDPSPQPLPDLIASKTSDDARILLWLLLGSASLLGLGITAVMILLGKFDGKSKTN